MIHITSDLLFLLLSVTHLSEEQIKTSFQQQQQQQQGKSVGTRIYRIFLMVDLTEVNI